MQVKVEIKVTVGNSEYFVTETCNLKKDHKFYADEHAAEVVGHLSERMKASLNPCYWDHSIAEVKND